MRFADVRRLVSAAMGLVLTATAALCVWIILWALNISAFDGILVVAGILFIAYGLWNLLPFLPGRRE
jgi:cytochrome c biogenesis protein CcdA